MITLIANILSTREPGESGERDVPPSRLEEGSPDTHRDDDVVTELVDRLESGEVSAEQVRSLREHLAPRRSRGVEVKLDHLRSTVFDLEAYTDALRAFIDEDGTAGDVLQELRDEIRETDEAIDELSTSVDRLEDGKDSLDERVDDLHEAVLSLSGYVLDLEERHSRQIEGVETEVTELDRSVSAEFDEMRRQLENLEQLSEQMRSLDSISAEVEQMQEDLEDLETFRSNFKRAVAAPDAATMGD